MLKKSWLINSDFTGDGFKDYVFLFQNEGEALADIILLEQTIDGFYSQKISQVNTETGSVELRKISYGESYWINWNDKFSQSNKVIESNTDKTRCVVFTSPAILISRGGEYERILSWHSGQHDFKNYLISESPYLRNYDSNRLKYECGFD